MSTLKHNDINLTSKLKIKRIHKNNGRAQKERKPTTEITSTFSHILPLLSYQNMSNIQKNRKQKSHEFLGPNLSKQMLIGSSKGLQNDNWFLKLKKKRKIDHSMSRSRRNSKSKFIRISNKTLEQPTLEVEKHTDTSISGSRYDFTTVKNILIEKVHDNTDSVSNVSPQVYRESDVSQKEVWFASDEGSDANDCHSESTPCKNLQAVLDRATDGVNIYITSETLSLDLVNDTVFYKTHRNKPTTRSCCLINSSLSYIIQSINGSKTDILCSG